MKRKASQKENLVVEEEDDEIEPEITKIQRKECESLENTTFLKPERVDTCCTLPTAPEEKSLDTTFTVVSDELIQEQSPTSVRS